MIQGREQTAGEGTQLAHEGSVARAAARLVAMARAFRMKGNSEESLTDELQAAQAELIRAVLLACGAGMTIGQVHALLIEPILTRPGITERAATLLRETFQSVQEHLR